MRAFLWILGILCVAGGAPAGAAECTTAPGNPNGCPELNLGEGLVFDPYAPGGVRPNGGQTQQPTPPVRAPDQSKPQSEGRGMIIILPPEKEGESK